ncbi:methyltransferase FkbM family [Methylocella silvestris BL2]|uniref:Methyltransferase FkbM family n=1 Tax=Methylocella silvestris (strain DSM 15510 / CIP 108128 / LMG 27833 / NCIMB 13906 / BL2) TaxID=395965 RepID=B8ERV6_METSB|nr:FkbM family methyltransferase [Methylocella silvestris]ACK51654.1 methyltransferase FkbM family [Methylocella silvestris BL2]
MEALSLLQEFEIHPSGIIHVGANDGLEFDAYRQSRADTVVYVEPISSIHASLKAKVESCKNHFAVRALCSSKSGEKVTFNISSNAGLSSSMLDLGNHAKIHPSISFVASEEMTTITLDDLLADKFPQSRFNLLVLDVQGAELMVLKGAVETLKSLDAVYTEISEAPLYDNGCTWRDLDSFLGPFDFWLKNMTIGRTGYGDALFVKNASFFSPLRMKKVDRPGVNVALHKCATQSSISAFSRAQEAQNAVNGVVTGSYAFHTAEEARPWWQVDLGALTSIDQVMVFNRLDIAADRAFSFVLKLSSDGQRFEQVYARSGEPFGGADGNPARIKLNGAVAQYVRIELAGGGYLHLDQVEVYTTT